MTTRESRDGAVGRLGLLHAAATGAAVLVFFVVLFWASVASGALPHLRTLFDTTGAGSPEVLVGYAVLVGALAGLLLAVFYNLFRFLAPRPKLDG